MKTPLLFCFFISLSFNLYSQVLAYDYVLGSRSQSGFCFDLTLSKAYVIGHQLNVNLSFHETIDDVNNNTNSLNQLYTFSGTEKTIYARVTKVSNGEFAYSELTLIKIPPFAPPGLCGYEICDFDSDGYELIDLGNFDCYDNIIYEISQSFCSSPDSEISTKYYLTENDALNDINDIDTNFSLTENLNIYRKTKNLVTNEFIIRYTVLILINCDDDTADSDSDGILDKLEDPNKNYSITDDDTDKDGLYNFEDDDDDEDGILTIDEDYNQNGDPTDDDIDDSGVPDYLENHITLSSYEDYLDSALLFPNPASEYVNVYFKYPKSFSYRIMTLNGSIIYENTVEIASKKNKIELSKLKSGLYFIEILTDNKSFTKKLVVK